MFALEISYWIRIKKRKRCWFDFTQDEGLDIVAEGLDTLKAMAHDMNEVTIPYLWLTQDQILLLSTNSIYGAGGRQTSSINGRDRS